MLNRRHIVSWIRQNVGRIRPTTIFFVFGILMAINTYRSLGRFSTYTTNVSSVTNSENNNILFQDDSIIDIAAPAGEVVETKNNISLRNVKEKDAEVVVEKEAEVEDTNDNNNNDNNNNDNNNNDNNNNDNNNNNSEEEKKEKKPMNILLLYADDWRHDTLGAAGNKIVKTPVLDQLAKEGIRFTHNCVTTSICWVSRATLFSGLYMARHNTKLPEEWFLDWKDCLYDLLKQAGYAVAHSGKMGIWVEYTAEALDFHVEEDGWHKRVIGGREWHVTEKNEADSLRFLRNRDKSKPFFLNTAFFATHAVDGDSRQYLPQSKSLSMYGNDTVVPTPVTGTQKAWEDMPPFFDENNEGRNRWRWRYDTPEKFQYMMKNYYRMASEVDSASGAIIEEIKRQGELDNTLIIFTTDNGNFHSEHGLADKWYPHQESIRVPLIIKDPRAPPHKAGTLNDEFTLNIDLAPTILSAAGLTPPKQMMGRDMSQLYLNNNNDNNNSSTNAGDDTNLYEAKKNDTSDNTTTTITSTTANNNNSNSTEWRKEFFYEHPTLFSKDFIPASEALVRKDYKYFYWPDYKVEQLFHIATDPYEENDIIKSEEPHHQKVLREMRLRFNELKTIVNSDLQVTL